MIELKCPFCQQELQQDQDGYYTCYTDNCGCMAFGGNGASGSESLWLALIHIQELLDIESAEHSMCHTQMLKTTEKLERTRKVLDRAKWWLHEIVESHRCTPISTAEIALKEITALEQGDVK